MKHPKITWMIWGYPYFKRSINIGGTSHGTWLMTGPSGEMIVGGFRPLKVFKKNKSETILW